MKALIDAAASAVVISGTGPRPVSLSAKGPRARVDASVTGRGKTWRATVPLHASRWGGPQLPLPSGEYVLEATDASGSPLRIDAESELVMLPTCRARVADGILFIGTPVDPAYDSGEGQDALERRYAHRPGVLENAVFFESFYGRNASCNPLAIDRELQRRAPNVTRYWSVVDLSVAVPDGAIAVVEGSPQWWQARGSARLLVVNDWLRRRFARRPGQVVLQTWHGTALKKLALQRSGRDPRRALAVLKESRRWNVLLAQNPYGANILRRAYAFFGRPTWVEGYPRNDILTTGDRTDVRARLGLASDTRVLLYAPTWRDNQDEIVDFLDPAALAADADAVVLVRGHSRTLLPGSDAEGVQVIDVTTYPDISELLLAADALITDYSSVMFDFSATGKPMYFFTPDLEHYRGEMRGFYFEFTQSAPGPLLHSQAELVAALADASVPAHFAEKYRAWRERFNGRDDGRAAERVVARILDQGFVDRI